MDLSQSFKRLDNIAKVFNRMDIMAKDIRDGILDPHTMEEYCVCHSFPLWKELYQQEAITYGIPNLSPIQWLSLESYLITQLTLMRVNGFCGH